MAQYWVYLNNAVAGPYGVEDLIRLRGFSRQTKICVDDASGNPTHWISPADIPELAHIFKAVDEHQLSMPSSAPAPKAQPKVARPVQKSGPAVVLRKAESPFPVWLAWVLAAGLAAAAFFTWSQYASRGALAEEQKTARALVENARLPSSSQYATVNQYIQEKSLRPRWEFERLQDGLSHVTLSWFSPTGSSVYAFETNTQAQTVRGINTAAIKLLSEGFAPPPAAPSKPEPVKKKSPADLFAASLDAYRQAIEGGDFQAVWGSFSQRKRTEMVKAGMSKDGFTRLQSLTFKVDSPSRQTVLKTKEESGTGRLVLLKQSQSGRPDIFIKQFWVFEHDEWKLDDEQKRAAEAPATAPATAPAPPATPASAPAAPPASSPAAAPSAPAGKPSPASLPGMSN